MNRNLRRWFTLAWFIGAVTALPGAAPASFEDGLRRHLDKLTNDELPGMAVLVARDGKIVFQGGFGFADIANKTPVTPETKFRIGSITKQFTAAAILRLEAEGRLALTDRLEKFFPGFARGAEVTLHQLITHTSGLRSYTNKPEFLGRVAQPIAPDELIAWFRDDPADFAPGAGFAYNNSGYFLLGEIVAKVAGKPFAAFLREAFFEPLGMKDTGIFVNAAPPAGEALGYAVADGQAVRALDWDMSWAGGAGALYSTVGDLFRWNEALFSGQVVPEEALKRMTTPVKLPPGVDGMIYGYGLVISKINRLPAISHGGALNGWSSDLTRLPEQNCTVVAFANARPPVAGRAPSAVVRNIVAKFLEAEIAQLPTPQQDPAVDKKTYANFLGRYSYPGAVMTVTTEDDRLFTQITGQQRFELFASAPDAFFLKGFDAQFDFQRNDQREVIAVQHSQDGNTFRAPRVVASEVKLTDAELDAILGQYQYGPTTVMTVTRDGDAVFAQLTGQPRFSIYPKSATDYEWRVVAAKVSFVKDADGKVTKASHTQNGRTFDAPKIK
ncbi:MAG: serine hydrolase [Opitutaceae bacterium]|nr:serine hydrolase [Opitutaceae bacterium]